MSCPKNLEGTNGLLMKVNAISPDSCSLSLYIHIVNRRNTTHFDYALKMTTAQVVETSVTVSNSTIQDYVYRDDHAQPYLRNDPWVQTFHIFYIRVIFDFLKLAKPQLKLITFIFISIGYCIKALLTSQVDVFLFNEAIYK